jgi:hypothetical protein
MFTFPRALPNKRLEQLRGRTFGEGKEEVDDLDKLPSFCVCAAPSRSTSSLCTCAVSGNNELFQGGGGLMTITDYVLLGFLLIGNGFAFSQMRRIQELERKLNLVLTQLGIDPNAEVAPSSDVISLAVDPQKRIEAIKAYRTQTGASVDVAAAVIDKIAASAKRAGAQQSVRATAGVEPSFSKGGS